MKSIYSKVLAEVPPVNHFLTADELNASSFALAAAHPELAEILTIGQTKEGRELFCLKLGSGKHTALMFGCPHPNEPIGTLMLEYFCQAFVASAEFRQELDYTFYIVKAWDEDGLRLNEGWLKGPYTMEHYARHFFRPAGFKQVDWTFPVQYKSLDFQASVPETKAMMALLDEIKPQFIYSLHNAGFGGAYWYLSEQLPQAYAALHQSAKRQGIPLNLGEAELPYVPVLHPAIYQALSIKGEVDYLAKYGVEDVRGIIEVGDCSASYAQERYNSFTLLTELPYFFDPRIDDSSPGSMLRRDAALQRLDWGETHDSKIRAILQRDRDLLHADNPFFLALTAFSKGGATEAMRRQIKSEVAYQRQATVAEEFDNLVVPRFYASLSLGMLIRMYEHELAHNYATIGHNIQNIKKQLRAASDDFAQHCAALAPSLAYKTIELPKLIAVQLESGLIVAEALKQRGTS